MTQPFTAEQSREIDDRIVAMIAAALGEGPAARRARAIANERWLNYQAETSEQDLRPLPSESRGLLARETIDSGTVQEMAIAAANATKRALLP